MAPQIPSGKYVMTDLKLHVSVEKTGGKAYLVGVDSQRVEIKSAAFGKDGWTITCQLFRRDYTGVLVAAKILTTASSATQTAR